MRPAAEELNPLRWPTDLPVPITSTMVVPLVWERERKKKRTEDGIDQRGWH